MIIFVIGALVFYIIVYNANKNKRKRQIAKDGLTMNNVVTKKFSEVKNGEIFKTYYGTWEAKTAEMIMPKDTWVQVIEGSNIQDAAREYVQNHVI